MTLAELLTSRRDEILDRWFDLVVKTYPGLSSIFLKKDNPWGNPVGVHLHSAITGIYDELLKDEADDKLPAYIDEIVRIRAVQEYSPSEATAIILLVKHVVREQIKKQAKEENVPPSFELIQELWDFESHVDTVTLIAFDMYTKCREKLFEIRLQDSKQRFSGLLRRAGLVCDFSEWADEKKDDTPESGDG
ncbi:RsbRD N-terminal domain-containing protein [Desulfobaculum bizertense]|uniref:RsbT co-antagonist protein rsbRD N-terminal domain-containing protein n=1 Tax=Desulfobaculum bizertense DSM 18034 TaxID=1121442 RepID=A0A1T4VDJ7_9BACT|nr:RsbRD N-terminal domain-containing protein [Desulfobaculum bizertense]UIJ37617.1 RsbRD N-terminal domain-containing protein [Desulfobaculum bizertense]SKA63032.1 RsbT co-antagonist protein rsbRD N-terminal domain-containing protein [Desulfobaculum bizertense DSM 18034]